MVIDITVIIIFKIFFLFEEQYKYTKKNLISKKFIFFKSDFTLNCGREFQRRTSCNVRSHNKGKKDL